MSEQPGPIALVGSGEYLESMAFMEASLLDSRPPRYVQLATAAVPDGPDVVEKWHRLGAEQAKRLGVEQVVLQVANRDDAERPEIAAMVKGAGLIYLSGGNPTYLADSLRDTLLWKSIEREWRAGAALAGCSAGAMALTSWVPSIRHPKAGGTDGLGLLPHMRVIPHFDAFLSRVPDIVGRFVLPHETDTTLVGVDEQTALVGGPYEWDVVGRSSVWILTQSGRTEVKSGSHLTTLASTT